MSIKQTLKSLKTDKLKRTKLITLITMIYNFVWAVAKIVSGIVVRGFFLCLSGASTLLLGFSKKTFYTNHNKDDINPYTKSKIIAILIMILSAVYCIYTARLFFVENTTNYGMILSIAIATFAFVELAISIYNLKSTSGKGDILLTSLRCCNLVSSFFALVLTQFALLSATGTPNRSYFNAITGVIFGALALVVGLVLLIVAIKKENKQKDNKKE